MSDDLISRQTLRIDMYHEVFEKGSDEQRWDSGCWIRYKMFERVVDRQPSAQPERCEDCRNFNKARLLIPQPERKEGKWIPVSERLPEEDTDVLISYRYKEGEGDTSHVYIDITSYGDMYFGGRKVEGVKHWRPPFEYFASNYEVIAWQPLPKPYKEEQE